MRLVAAALVALQLGDPQRAVEYLQKTLALDPNNDDAKLDLARAQALAARTYEFSEYLVDVLGVTDVGARWNGRLTYHPSCHLLRGLGKLCSLKE